MPARILEGKPVALEIASHLRDGLASFREDAGRSPSLAIVRAGDDESALAYQRAITRAARSVHVQSCTIEFGEDAAEAAVVESVQRLNADNNVDGVLILQPLPGCMSSDRITRQLSPSKDVDGVTPTNAGLLFHGDPTAFQPSTPAGGMALLRHYGIEMAGRHAVVVGRSAVVGRPMALLLLAANATVTICHTQTPDIARHTSQADILVAAAGSPGLIGGDMVKPGATVIDFGVSVVDGRLVGDVCFDEVAEVAAAITPVPGGTGRVTTMIVIDNTLRAARRNLAK